MLLLKNRIIYSLIALLTLSVLIASCKRKLLDPKWDTKIISPIAFSSLDINDIINNSDLIKADENNLLHIIYSNEVYRVDNPLDSLINLSIAPATKDLSLDSLKLASQKISDTIVLGDIIAQSPSGVPRPADGSSISVFFLPIINSLLSTQANISNEIDISAFLEEAYLSNAFLDLAINNNTNFEIINMSFKLRNADDNALLYEEVIPLIEPNSSYKKLGINIAEALAGNPIKGKLILSSSGFEFGIPAGQSSAKIYFTDNILFNANLRDIQVSSAKAIFPAQEVINETDTIGIFADNGVEIVFAKIDSGIVNLKGYSTIPTDIDFTYSVPSLTKNGKGFSFTSVIDETFDSPQNAADTNYYFNGMDFDLSVDQIVGKRYVNRKYNTFVNQIVASIEESNGIIDLSLADKIFIDVQIVKLKPSYVKGYLGSSSERIVQKVKLDAFKNVKGTLNFDQVKLELEILNDIGVQGLLQIHSIKAKNSLTGKSVNYSGNLGPFAIKPAIEVGDGFLTQKSIVELNNVADFLSILPDELEVDMEIVLNKGFNDYLYADFLHSGASFAANFNLDIPLVTSASGLELFEVSSVKLDELELPVGVNNGVLSLIVNNGFPIDADLDLFFTTSTGKMLKAFSSDQIIRAATINPIDNKVSAKTKTKIDYTIDYDDVQLLKEATNMMVKAKFDTPSTVPFYSYYSFDVQVVADFGYQVNKAK